MGDARSLLGAGDTYIRGVGCGSDVCRSDDVGDANQPEQYGQYGQVQAPALTDIRTDIRTEGPGPSSRHGRRRAKKGWEPDWRPDWYRRVRVSERLIVLALRIGDGGWVRPLQFVPAEAHSPDQSRSHTGVISVIHDRS